MSRPADDDARARAALLAALTERRAALGLTIAHVAARMQVAHGTVAGMERGETDPRLSVLQQYARAVGLRVTVGLRAGPELAAEMCGEAEGAR